MSRGSGAFEETQEASVIGAQNCKGKGTRDKTEKKGRGAEHADLVGHVKILASVLGQWEAICKCHD